MTTTIITVQRPPYAAKIEGKDNAPFGPRSAPATLRKESNGKGKPATYFTKLVDYITLDELSGSGEEAIDAITRRAEGLDEVALIPETVEWIQGYQTRVLRLEGWRLATEEEVAAVLAISEWEKTQAAETRKARKLEEEALRIRKKA